MDKNATGALISHVFSNVLRNGRFFLLAVFALAGVCRATISAEMIAPATVRADAPSITWQVKMGGHVAVDLDNPNVAYEAGGQLPLFAQTEDSYIAIITTYDGATRLCGFPRFVQNESSAWVSAEKLLVFARRTASVRVVFSFDKDEVVPLLRENGDGYTVEVQRHGRRLSVDVPKKTPGVVLVPVQAEAANLRSEKLRTGRAGFAPSAGSAATVSVPSVPRVSAPSADSSAYSETLRELARAKMEEEILQDIYDKVERQRATDAVAREITGHTEKTDQPQPPNIPTPVVTVEAAKPAPLPVVLTVSASREDPKPAKKMPRKQEEKQTLRQLLLAFFRENAVPLILTGIMLPLGIILASRWRERHPKELHSGQRQTGQAAAPAPAMASEVFTFSSVGESVSPEGLRHQPEDDGDLSGTLSGYILPQVVQFFCSARESGRMMIRQNSGMTEELIFHDGQIIDARSGNLGGKDAAHAILLQREGKFSFHRGNTAGRKPSIREETMALLLEAHKHIDEVRDSRAG